MKVISSLQSLLLLLWAYVHRLALSLKGTDLNEGL